MPFSIDQFQVLTLVSAFDLAISWEEQFCYDLEQRYPNKRIEVVFIDKMKNRISPERMASWYQKIDQYFVGNELANYAFSLVTSERTRNSLDDLPPDQLLIDPYDLLDTIEVPYRLAIRLGSGKSHFEELYQALFENELRIRLSLVYSDHRIEEQLLETTIGGHHFSISININDTYWLTKSILLKYIRIGGLVAGDSHKQEYQYSNPRFQSILLLRIIRRRIASKFHKKQWHMLWTDEAGNEKEISPPGMTDWADPFLVEHQGKRHLFFEAFSSRQAHYGRIAYLSEDALQEKEIHPVLDTGFHLSFPNIFRYKNTYYMVPETGANRTISLYKATRFPLIWKFEKDLLTDLKAVDSDIFQYDGRWWLFTCIQATPTKGTYHELHIFHATTPLSNAWQAHTHNPVVISSIGGRLGGKVRKEGNRLIRVGQINTKTYGYGLCEMEITKLTINNFEEKQIRVIKPSNFGRSIKAIHTLNQVGSIQVLDYAK